MLISPPGGDPAQMVQAAGLVGISGVGTQVLSENLPGVGFC